MQFECPDVFFKEASILDNPHSQIVSRFPDYRVILIVFSLNIFEVGLISLTALRDRPSYMHKNECYMRQQMVDKRLLTLLYWEQIEQVED